MANYRITGFANSWILLEHSIQTGLALNLARGVSVISIRGKVCFGPVLSSLCMRAHAVLDEFLFIKTHSVNHVHSGFGDEDS